MTATPPKTYKATQLYNRQKVLALQEGDTVTRGPFEVEVNEVTVAMGGDVCIAGTVKSWLTNHQYKVYFGEKVFWGPKFMVKGDLYDYLNKRNIVKEKSQP